uniref:Uncharacterized protein n=1 Tax=Trypanosoma congolense (strain IL3000) TaxID=1068625 RepID=G0UMB6_TRYCI|nr:hypothetical protein, unlikely [Trypanosoma congolense IL3000]
MLWEIGTAGEGEKMIADAVTTIVGRSHHPTSTHHPQGSAFIVFIFLLCTAPAAHPCSLSLTLQLALSHGSNTCKPPTCERQQESRGQTTTTLITAVLGGKVKKRKRKTIEKKQSRHYIDKKCDVGAGTESGIAG